MTATAMRCLVCNRVFQGFAKNRGVLQINNLTHLVDLCHYHLEALEASLELARKIMEAKGKP